MPKSKLEHAWWFNVYCNDASCYSQVCVVQFRLLLRIASDSKKIWLAFWRVRYYVLFQKIEVLEIRSSVLPSSASSMFGIFGFDITLCIFEVYFFQIRLHDCSVCSYLWEILIIYIGFSGSEFAMIWYDLPTSVYIGIYNYTIVHYIDSIGNIFYLISLKSHNDRF